MTPILKITDGTTEISLIQTGGNAFYLDNWTPAVATFKGGGTWQLSSLADGRKLVHYQWKNAIESFDMKVADIDEDSLIRQGQELRRLLISASDYWTQEYNTTPVWIEAKGDTETNSRYALIYTWSLPQDSNPFSQPFIQRRGERLMNDWTLTLERGHWLGDEPTESTCVQISGTQLGLPTEITETPSADTDDAYVNHFDSTISTTGTTLDFGNSGNNSQDLGVRFRSVQIPLGATIESAFLRFEAAVSGSGTVVNAIIYGQDGTAPAVFGTYANFIGRTRTSAFAEWDNVAAWTIGTSYDTPDISAIVQEIVDRGDWLLGDNMVIFVQDNGSTSVGVNRRQAASWDHVTRDAPELHVTWSYKFGRAATCDNEVFVANKHNLASLTDIYIDDGGVMGANLMLAAPPFDLLPAVPVANDAIYFGIDTSFADSGPFCSLVFDLATAGAGYTGAWEYWDGGAPWATLTVQDNTDTAEPLDTAGVASVNWEQPTDWVEANLNTVLGYGPAVTGFWMRMRVTATPGALTAPNQQNRDPYTITWPYVEIAAAQVAGDIDALARVIFTNWTYQVGPQEFLTSRMIVGLRSVSRGENFQAYLNCAPDDPDDQNPTGITLEYGASTTVANDSSATTGHYALFNPGGTLAFADRVRFLLDTTIAPEYFGEFHAYVRCEQAGGAAGDVQLRLLIYTGLLGDVYVTESVSTTDTGQWMLIDMGRVSIPPPTTRVVDLDFSAGIYIQVANTGTPDLYLYDLVLIPVDEYAGDFRTTNIFNTFAAARLGEKIDIDSISQPAVMVRATIEDDAGGFNAYFQSISSGPMILHNDTRQRLWTLSSRYELLTGIEISEPWLSHSVQAFRNQRYLSMRGDR